MWTDGRPCRVSIHSAFCLRVSSIAKWASGRGRRSGGYWRRCMVLVLAACSVIRSSIKMVLSPPSPPPPESPSPQSHIPTTLTSVISPLVSMRFSIVALIAAVAATASAQSYPFQPNGACVAKCLLVSTTYQDDLESFLQSKSNVLMLSLDLTRPIFSSRILARACTLSSPITHPAPTSSSLSPMPMNAVPPSTPST